MLALGSGRSANQPGGSMELISNDLVSDSVQFGAIFFRSLTNNRGVEYTLAISRENTG